MADARDILSQYYGPGDPRWLTADNLKVPAGPREESLTSAQQGPSDYAGRFMSWLASKVGHPDPENVGQRARTASDWLPPQQLYQAGQHIAGGQPIRGAAEIGLTALPLGLRGATEPMEVQGDRVLAKFLERQYPNESPSGDIGRFSETGLFSGKPFVPGMRDPKAPDTLNHVTAWDDPVTPQSMRESGYWPTANDAREPTSLKIIEGGNRPLTKEDYAASRMMRNALNTGADYQGVLSAGRPLLERMRDEYGFTVMQPGLPKDPHTLSRALLETSRGLSLLGLRNRTYPSFGIYYGRPRLQWFEDGYGGSSGLAVPNDVKAEDLAAFVRPRLFSKSEE